MKPIPTMLNPLQTVDMQSLEHTETRYERSDVCALPRAVVVAESVIAPVIANAFLEKFGGDSISEIKNDTQARIMNRVPTIHISQSLAFPILIIVAGIWLSLFRVNLVVAQSQQTDEKLTTERVQDPPYQQYEVKAGETLYSISKKFGCGN